jgi:hypothetical protein
MVENNIYSLVSKISLLRSYFKFLDVGGHSEVILLQNKKGLILSTMVWSNTDKSLWSKV